MFDEISEHHGSAKLTHKINQQGRYVISTWTISQTAWHLYYGTWINKNAYLKKCAFTYIFVQSKQLTFI